jgi:phosphatidate cytidylyltransferase
MGTSEALVKRIIVNSVLIVMTLICVFVWPSWAFMMWLMLFIGLGLNEFFDMILKKGVPVYKKTGIFMGLIIPLIILKPVEEWILAFILLTFILFFALQFFKKNHTDAILGISTTVFGVIYVSWLASYLLKIRQLEQGAFLLLLTLLLCKGSDVGAFFVGKSFGRHKLLKQISPNKSIEGSIGGFCFTILIALASKAYLRDISLNHLVILGVLVGLAAQLGDLSESLIKRDCLVKDSGSLIPGQGGILDILDSVLFSAPIVYLYLKYII